MNNLLEAFVKKAGGEFWGLNKRVCQDLDVTPNTFRAWCSNKKIAISHENRAKIARYLGITEQDVDELRAGNKKLDSLDHNSIVNFANPAEKAVDLKYIPVYAGITGEAFYINFNDLPQREETMPVLQPTNGKYFGLRVRNNDLKSFEIEKGEYLEIDPTKTWAQHEALLVVEIAGMFEVRRCIKDGDQVTLIHAQPQKHPNVKMPLADLKVIGCVNNIWKVRKP
jgi:SOS-response transcriptional repressor LexA